MFMTSMAFETLVFVGVPGLPRTSSQLGCSGCLRMELVLYEHVRKEGIMFQALSLLFCDDWWQLYYS